MPRRRSSRSTTSVGGTIIILAVLAVLYFGRGCVPGLNNVLPAETPVPVDTNATPAAAFPENIAKPAPVVETFKGCPPKGDGGDQALNYLKNRVDVASFAPVKLEALLALRGPSGTERRNHDSLSPLDREAIQKYEGAPVSTVGYLIDTKKQGPESTNCHSTEDVDYHMWLVTDPNLSRTNSLVVEITPRVNAKHPEWTSAALSQLVKVKAKVRISGWVLFDEEHPDQLQQTRGTLWEIHPVMILDVIADQ